MIIKIARKSVLSDLPKATQPIETQLSAQSVGFAEKQTLRAEHCSFGVLSAVLQNAHK